MSAPVFLAAWLLLAAPAAQQRDFLTGPEVDLVREAQEPSDRIKLYLKFARVRLDALDKEFARESPQRGNAIHDLLDEYDRIMDALDDIADLAETKRALVRKGLEAALKETPEFLKRLQAFEAGNPKDIEEYRFALRQAIETTQASLEATREHLGKLPPDRKTEKEREKAQDRKRKEGREK